MSNPLSRALVYTFAALLCWGTGTTALCQDESLEPASTASPDTLSTMDETVPARVDVRNVNPDEEIEDRLSGIFDATGWFEDLDVTARNGVVFLEGSTSERERKDWAGRLARNTESVVAVVNNVNVSSADVLDFAETFSVVRTSLQELLLEFWQRSPLIAAGLLVLVLTWIVAKITQSAVRRISSRLRTSLQDLMLQLTTIGIWIIGIMVAAVVVFPGMTPAKALAVLGLGSVAVGFAFKDIFENFFAGILILWKYPFDRGDFIECGEISGKIEEITVRMSMIRQVDGQLAVVPNAMLFKNVVDVLTSKPSRRVTVIVGVAYATDLDECRKVLRQAVASCSTVKSGEPIEVFLQEFAASSINFEVTWWTSPTPLDIRKSRDEVVASVKRALDQAGVEIPFPQRTLWFSEPLQTQRARTANGEPANVVGGSAN